VVFVIIIVLCICKPNRAIADEEGGGAASKQSNSHEDNKGLDANNKEPELKESTPLQPLKEAKNNLYVDRANSAVHKMNEEAKQGNNPSDTKNKEPLSDGAGLQQDPLKKNTATQQMNGEAKHTNGGTKGNKSDTNNRKPKDNLFLNRGAKAIRNMNENAKQNAPTQDNNQSNTNKAEQPQTNNENTALQQDEKPQQPNLSAAEQQDPLTKNATSESTSMQQDPLMKNSETQQASNQNEGIKGNKQTDTNNKNRGGREVRKMNAEAIQSNMGTQNNQTQQE